MAVFVAFLPLAGCDDSEPSGPDDNGDGPEPLPTALALRGFAAIELEAGSASCELFYHIELEEEVEDDDDDVRTYRGTAGGEALRSVMHSDGTGFMLWPLLHSGATVRVWNDSIEVAADGHDTTSVPFYREIMFLAGSRTGIAEANGDWTCAPLEIDSEGLVDTAIVAPGTWTIEDLPVAEAQ
jgi:hypothetical protein